MSPDHVYSDKLVSIVADEMIFNNYYFPTFSKKRVRLSDIENICTYKPTLINGKFRYWGTGDFIHWFPLDPKRSSRDLIFELKRKYKKVKICFTVENSELFIKALDKRLKVKLNNLEIFNEKNKRVF